MAKRKAGKSAAKAKTTRKPASARPAARGKGAASGSAKKGAAPKRRLVKKAVVTKKRAVARPAIRKRAAASRKSVRPTKKPSSTRTSAPPRQAAASTKAGATKKRAPATPAPRAASPRKAKAAPARLDRDRRHLADDPVSAEERALPPTPPSSLNLVRHGSAARTGRAEMAESLADHASMTPEITGGDVDVDVETAYFSGDEAPGGDNPTPDQDIVDDIGKALGVEYEDTEELRASDKVADRDKNRWELDPASAEDYRTRDKE